MYSTLGGAGGGEVDGERAWEERRGLDRRGGAVAPIGFKSESRRSWSEGGVLSRFRLEREGEEVEGELMALCLGSVSHGIVRGGIS